MPFFKWVTPKLMELWNKDEEDGDKNKNPFLCMEKWTLPAIFSQGFIFIYYWVYGYIDTDRYKWIGEVNLREVDNKIVTGYKLV